MASDDVIFDNWLASRAMSAKYAQAETEISQWAQSGIGCIALGSDQYPELLGRIYEPPLILFYRGKWPAHSDCSGMFAVVGSRKADHSGCHIAEQFGAELARLGVCIVSGLAIGIDSAAHQGALTTRAAFPTLAVLGSGLNHIYPASNRKLFHKIINQSGLVLSQFEPDEPPYPVNFLKRNRVIAGLAQGALVIQAGGRSGSLVTARFALEEGRDVFVVPGSIHDPRYSGSHELIKQGAYLVTDVQDILHVLPQFQSATNVTTQSSSSIGVAGDIERTILEKIKQSGKLHINDLIKELAQDIDITLPLLELEMAGAVHRLPGNYWAARP